MTSVRILHLEDSDLDGELVAHALSKEKIRPQIRRVTLKQEFLAAIQKETFDLILADYSLPDFDGMSALRAVRQIDPHLPFIFVSGVLGEEIAIETLKNGATDYVLKKRLERLPLSVTRALKEASEREERRQTAEALRETEQRLQTIADSAPVLIWISGPDGEPVFFNRPWLAFTGRTSGEEVGAGWTNGLHPDDLERWASAYGRHFGNRTPFTTDLRLRRHDGEFRWLLVNGVPYVKPSGAFAGFITSGIDVTELKRTEERLRHVAKLESLGILAGGIAHDFNNLLTGILGHAHLLMEDLEPSDPRTEFAQNIVQAADAAAQLTRQMLAYSGRGRFVIEPVNISDVVSANRAFIEASISKNVQIHFDLDGNLPCVDADPGQVQQIIMNLIINAGEAAEQRSGKVVVRTCRKTVTDSKSESNLTGDIVPPGLYVVLEVVDSGHGMDDQTRARIFDPFFTTKFTGRGLGLAAVMGIVRGHKGAIQLDTAPDRGSTFRVLLPQSEAPVDEPQRGFEESNRTTGTILVVDDVSLVSDMIQVTLSRAGFNVLTAPNGQSALELVQDETQEIDLVLLDMTMPVMSGEQTLRWMKQLRPELPVIGMSGFSESEALARFGEDLDGFLQKPFHGTNLLRAIWKSLGRAPLANSSTV